MFWFCFPFFDLQHHVAVEQEVPGGGPGGQLRHHQGEGCGSDPPARGRGRSVGRGGLQRLLSGQSLDGFYRTVENLTDTSNASSRPFQSKNSFFVVTNVIVSKNQKQGKCPEVLCFSPRLDVQTCVALQSCLISLRWFCSRFLSKAGCVVLIRTVRLEPGTTRATVHKSSTFSHLNVLFEEPAVDPPGTRT